MASVRKASKDSSVLAQADACKTSSQHSSGPRESRWRTWCAMAEQRGSAPLPVTSDLVSGGGHSLNSVDSSAAQYFSVAKSFHSEAATTGTRTWTTRSIKLFAALHVELCDAEFASRVFEAYDTLRFPRTTVWTSQQIRAWSVVGFCCEVWRLQLQCVKMSPFRKRARSSSFLPVSKNDPSGLPRMHLRAQTCPRLQPHRSRGSSLLVGLRGGSRRLRWWLGRKRQRWAIVQSVQVDSRGDHASSVCPNPQQKAITPFRSKPPPGPAWP